MNNTDELKLKKGETVVLNIPFHYTIGEYGYYTDKVLETIADCKAELLAEIQSGVFDNNEILITVSTNDD